MRVKVKKNLSNFAKEALLLEELEDGKIKCLVCRHNCILSEGQLGICKTRKVEGGKLQTLVYGNISSLSLNPIEKKPFFHFFPGTFATTVGSWSCNCSCPWCQNYGITKVSPEEAPRSDFLSPEALLELISQEPGSSGVSLSFNEPTLMAEYAIDVIKLLSSQRPDLYSNFVTNGYMTLEFLDQLITAGLSAMVVSIKGGKEAMKKYSGINLDFVLENISSAIEKGVHVEIVILVIPTVSDSPHFFETISQRFMDDYGPDIPVHFNAYYPAYNFHEPTTPVKTLEKGRSIAMSKGLKFVYIGNVLGHPALNTYCPTCNEKIILRSQSRFLESKLTKDNRCPYCNTRIPIHTNVKH